MKRYIRSSEEFPKKINSPREMDLNYVVSWDGYYYGVRRFRGKTRFYKSKTPRFDNTFGGTYEISQSEYADAVNNYQRVFHTQEFL